MYLFVYLYGILCLLRKNIGDHMVQEVFTDEEAQAIVDTLILGNNEYLEERASKKNSMAVSGGYAWTRPNHLDDSFAKAGLPFISEYKLKTAGESWQYLEFHASNDNKKTMLIIKNKPRLEATYESKSHKHSQYLIDCASINSNIAKKEPFKGVEEKIQLELFADFPDFSKNTVKEQFKDFQAFYVIVYEVDQSKHITKVEVVMPNPHTQVLERVQDLSNCLRESEITQYESVELQDLPEEAPLLSEEYGYVAKEGEEAQ